MKKTTRKIDFDTLYIIIGVIALIIITCVAINTHKNPITPKGGESADTAVSISSKEKIEINIWFYTSFDVNQEAYFSWDDGEKVKLSKSMSRAYETAIVPDEAGIHKLVLVYGRSTKTYYYKVEES